MTLPKHAILFPPMNSNQRGALSLVAQGRRTLCETMGLSVYAEQNDAIQCAKQYNLGDKIATIALTEQSGKLLRTHGGFDSHVTWWKAEHFNPNQAVLVVVDI